MLGKTKNINLAAAILIAAVVPLSFSISIKDIRAFYYFAQGSKQLDRYRYDSAIREFRKAVLESPDFYDAHTQLGVALREKARTLAFGSASKPYYEEAVGSHKNAIRLRPGYELAHASLGFTYLAFRQRANAAWQFGEALEINPSSSRAYLGFGWLYNDLFMRKESIESYHKALEMDIQKAKTYNNLGAVYMDMRRYGPAKDAFQRAVNLDDRLAMAYRNLGVVYLHEKMFQDAYEAFAKTIEFDPENKQAYAYLYFVSYLLGKQADMEWIYKKMSGLGADKAIIHKTLGNIYREFQYYAPAIKEFTTALELDSSQSDRWYQLGNVYRDMGDHAAALGHYEKAIRQNNGTELSGAWHEAGRIWALKQDKEKTLLYINKAMELSPVVESARLLQLADNDHLARYLSDIKIRNRKEFAKFYGLKGYIYEKSKRPEALQVYREALAIYPEFDERSVYEGIGRIYEERGDYNNAESYYRKAAEVDPSETYAYSRMGRLYFIRGQNRRAMEEYKKILDRKKDAAAYLAIGECWEKEGNLEQAVAIYKEGIAVLPRDDSPKIFSHLKFLKSLAGLRLAGFYIMARGIETRIEKYLDRQGLVPALDRTISRLQTIYYSRSFRYKMILASIMLAVSLAAGLFYFTRYKRIRDVPPEKIEWMGKRLGDNLFLQETQYSYFLTWGGVIAILAMCSYFSNISPLALIMITGAIIYDTNYGLLRRFHTGSLRGSLLLSGTLQDCLGSEEKILYCACSGKTKIFYIITSRRILCFFMGLWGEPDKLHWDCEFKDLEKITPFIPLSCVIFGGLIKALKIYVKDGGVRNISFLPKVDIAAITRILTEKQGRMMELA